MQEWLTSLAALSESSSDAVIVKDSSGRILAWNHAASDLYGFAAPEVLGRPVSIVAPPGGWGEILALIQSAQKGIVTQGHRTIRRRKDGSNVYISLTVVPIIDAQGNVLGICTTARDVTHSDEPSRYRETMWLASIVESSEDAIIGKTTDGEIVSWNAAAERLYLWRASEVLGRHISILTPPDHADEVPELMARVARGENVDHFLTERVDRYGKRLQVSLSLSPIKDTGGHLVGISTVARRVPDEAS